MFILSDKELSELFKKAEHSKRKRAHFNIHKQHSEKVQRLLIALIKDSYVEPHSHVLPNQWEMFVILKGKIELTIFNDCGEVLTTKKIGSESSLPVIQMLPNVIHSVKCMSEKALLLEIKEGPYVEKQAKLIASF